LQEHRQRQNAQQTPVFAGVSYFLIGDADRIGNGRQPGDGSLSRA